MTSIGDRIRQRRTELGWTQDRLAQKAGISKSFLSDLENTKRSVSANNLLDLGRALGVSLDYLMTGQAEVDMPQNQVPIPATLARFAAQERLSFRQTLVLFEMQQVVARHAGKKNDGLKGVDWQKFYEAVKEFMQDD